ncbi:DUF1642 domain-containing protein [Pediococcus stilesii]|nr:DUF1642 domain-containing protein [Pediococcus stilesii]
MDLAEVKERLAMKIAQAGREVDESVPGNIAYDEAKVSIQDYRYALDLVGEIDYPSKPVVPQFVADWITIAALNCDYEPIRMAEWIADNVDEDTDYHFDWLENLDNQRLLLTALISNYEVEKETEYQVKVKGIAPDKKNVLRYHKNFGLFGLAGVTDVDMFKTKFTKEWLKDNWSEYEAYNNAGLLEFEEVEDE